MKEALGLVEIKGMSTAVEVADVMVKTANVRILGLENARGLGYMTVKVIGDVGAVSAAVDAGKKTGLQYDKLVSAKVIPRPADGMASVFCKEPVQKKPHKVADKPKAKSKKKKAAPPKQEEKKKIETPIVEPTDIIPPNNENSDK
ncbi:ethanolamine utilization protein similar to PduA/PduJ [Lachnospiraceae bacterium KM106-2]|nr:ethanolamine utilization protein similar to PduA/PduJ [Lachnospiraceae bacterium KM106-2]